MTMGDGLQVPQFVFTPIQYMDKMKIAIYSLCLHRHLQIESSLHFTGCLKRPSIASTG
jgi:hypothetical protein